MNSKYFVKVILIFFLFTGSLFCQSFRVDKIEPANWWAGMKTNSIQLMVYGENLSGCKAAFNTSDIKIKKINDAENPNYSFVDISITKKAKPGNYKLVFEKDKQKIEIDFPLLKRENSSCGHKGFNSEDVVYLIMPDRFADGDTSNNISKNLINDFKPNDPLGRHGGDLRGIINHLSYFNELGVTALWLTPVLENNSSISYHGYAASNFYKIDERLGTNETYKELVAKAHETGIKIIYDHVSNHITINHPWVKNPPFADWLNGTEKNHLNAWHDKMVLTDMHSAQLTKDHVTKGWFVDEMPDLNQSNPFVKNYLIQNTIWWIEYAGIDGIREDTYPYVTPEFTSEWAKRVLEEYPTLNIVGEVWIGETAYLAPYQKNSKLNKNFNTNLPVVTDFALQNAYEDYLRGKSGLYSIFDALAKDYLYEDTNNLLTFADNHDVARAMLNSNRNVEKVKTVFTHMLTSRGIPQILYGTEIGIVGKEEHGYLRADFRGGFPGNSSSAFEEAGRTELENNLFGFFQKLISIRKKYKSLSCGTLQHLPPIDNVYIYSKKLNGEMMLIVLNGDDSKKEIDKTIIESLCEKNVKLFDVWNNKTVDFAGGKIIVEPFARKIYKIN
jgi:neopullulanase